MEKITLYCTSVSCEKSVFSRGLAYVARRRSIGKNDDFLDFGKRKDFKTWQREIQKIMIKDQSSFVFG